MKFPEGFVEKYKEILGDEARDFLASFEEEAVSAFRVNPLNPNHSYLSQLDVTYKTPDLMSHFLPPHEVSFTFCCSSIVFPR
ncbi:hypothetical protein SPAR146_1409 [Streptococcus pneumoniae NorthCarolina6A-23]|nr:hypothetical protein [Streptococcus pneumoniae]EHE73100.1 hypothetical protein SPAR146_1409 [Streptococcus pneumoniae NorthCarolina6A-23]